MASLFDTARPKTLAEVVGQDKAIAQIDRVLARGWGGRSWLITGSSGTGKTTLARILAAQGAGQLAITEIDAQDVSFEFLRDFEAEFRCTAIPMRAGEPTGKALIINEVHGMRSPVVSRMLTLLEGGRHYKALPAHMCVVLTSTKSPGAEGTLFEDCEDGGPFVSRCMEIRLEDGPDTQRAFAARAKAIAMSEGIDGLPEGVYLKAVQECRCNFRALLQRIESGRFREDARKSIEADLAMLKSTKGDYAAQRRAELTATLNSL